MNEFLKRQMAPYLKAGMSAEDLAAGLKLMGLSHAPRLLRQSPRAVEWFVARVWLAARLEEKAPGYETQAKAAETLQRYTRSPLNQANVSDFLRGRKMGGTGGASLVCRVVGCVMNKKAPLDVARERGEAAARAVKPEMAGVFAAFATTPREAWNPYTKAAFRQAWAEGFDAGLEAGKDQ